MQENFAKMIIILMIVVLGFVVHIGASQYYEYIYLNELSENEYLCYTNKARNNWSKFTKSNLNKGWAIFGSDVPEPYGV